MELYAKDQYEKVWKILHESFKTQEEQSPEKLSLANNIGSIYFNQMKYIKARDILVPTLEIMQRQDHRHTIICMKNLASTYAK